MAQGAAAAGRVVSPKGASTGARAGAGSEVAATAAPTAAVVAPTAAATAPTAPTAPTAATAAIAATAATAAAIVAATAVTAAIVTNQFWASCLGAITIVVVAFRDLRCSSLDSL